MLQHVATWPARPRRLLLQVAELHGQLPLCGLLLSEIRCMGPQGLGGFPKWIVSKGKSY